MFPNVGDITGAEATTAAKTYAIVELTAVIRLCCPVVATLKAKPFR